MWTGCSPTTHCRLLHIRADGSLGKQTKQTNKNKSGAFVFYHKSTLTRRGCDKKPSSSFLLSLGKKATPLYIEAYLWSKKDTFLWSGVQKCMCEHTLLLNHILWSQKDTFVGVQKCICEHIVLVKHIYEARKIHLLDLESRNICVNIFG